MTSFYVHHLTASDGTGIWEGVCPDFPRQSYCSEHPSLALAGIRRLVTHKLELEARYGA